MRIPLLFCCILFVCQLSAQSLEQHVIGSAGNFSTTASSATLSWTLGEVITTTESSTSAILTQGFQQPIIINPLSVPDLGYNDLDIRVFPNPTVEQITIQKNQDEAMKAQLINVLGQIIGEYPLNDFQTQLDLRDLPAANYLLQVKTDDNLTVQTFKIQKIK